MDSEWSSSYSFQNGEPAFDHSSRWDYFAGPPTGFNSPTQGFPYPHLQKPASSSSANTQSPRNVTSDEFPCLWNKPYADTVHFPRAEVSSGWFAQPPSINYSQAASDLHPPSSYPFSTVDACFPLPDCDSTTSASSLPFPSLERPITVRPQEPTTNLPDDVIPTSNALEGLIAAGDSNQDISQSFDRKMKISRIVVGTFAVRAASERKRKHAHRFRCFVCNQGFTSRANERRHLRAHFGIKPFSCSCGSPFTSRCDLMRHMKTSLHPPAESL